MFQKKNIVNRCGVFCTLQIRKYTLTPSTCLLGHDIIMFHVQYSILKYIFLCKNCLNSFSVPYDVSMGGSKEPWAEIFMAKMQSKWGNCKQAWRTLQMEVSECFPQAIAL